MTILWVGVAVLAVALVAACRARDPGSSDSAAPDTARSGDTAADSGAVTKESGSAPASTAGAGTSRTTRAVRGAGDSARDSALPPDDSIRAMRPDMPQITPEKRPRTWRGFKLPEEMPVRAPVETIGRVEQAADSVMKGESTKPLPPDR